MGPPRRRRGSVTPSGTSAPDSAGSAARTCGSSRSPRDSGSGPSARALEAGLSDVAENYAQELVAKHRALGGDLEPRWHFVGRLQRNKIRQVAGFVGTWQSVDRIRLVTEIARRAPGAEVLVQVNVSGEEQKGGCDPDDVAGIVGAARDEGLAVAGLMAVGPTGSPESAREPFRRLVGLADDLALPERSIGMSHDLEVAVEEGATMVRIGRALFGERPESP
ncbi:MAG: YggS family pyridoxal phosphate enzyme [Acidimicrobiia bacterium]|nr:YggS family pyridoxal phosphate enzyme [Acidimicrobiia bacterium]